MLLYDRLLSLAKAYEDTSFAKVIANAPVYDFSEVVSVFDNKPMQDKVPMRPPHETLWAEWSHQDNSSNKSGCLLHPLNQLPPNRLPDSVATHWYGVHGFVWSSKRNEVFQLREIVGVGFGDDYLVPEHVAVQTPFPHVFGTRMTFDDTVDITVGGMAVMFSAFSLLHCRNVTTEIIEPSKIECKKAQRGKRPKPASYRVIRLTKPKVRYSPSEDESEDDASKVRFHLVRGHFKNLQHDRYKEKGWHWWPAHWRGDEKLGTSPKVYKVSA